MIKHQQYKRITIVFVIHRDQVSTKKYDIRFVLDFFEHKN